MMGVAKGLENKIRFLGRIKHVCGATVCGGSEKSRSEKNNKQNKLKEVGADDCRG